MCQSTQLSRQVVSEDENSTVPLPQSAYDENGTLIARQYHWRKENKKLIAKIEGRIDYYAPPSKYKIIQEYCRLPWCICYPGVPTCEAVCWPITPKDPIFNATVYLALPTANVGKLLQYLRQISANLGPEIKQVIRIIKGRTIKEKCEYNPGDPPGYNQINDFLGQDVFVPCSETGDSDEDIYDY